MRRAKHLFHAWSFIEEEISSANRIFLFLDFDGTLAPIRPRPEQARLPAGMRRVLSRIRRNRSVVIAVISGRSVRDLGTKVPIRGLWFAGTHGYVVLTPSRREISVLTPSQRARMKLVLRDLKAGLAKLPGIQLEPKEATIAIHYRRAKPESERAAARIVRTVLAAHPGLEFLHGKKIWEFLPGANVDKWTGARIILKREKWRASRDLLFFLGDDLTDESIFRAMKGVSVAVGKQTGTAARYFLRSTDEVRKFLSLFEAAAKR